MGNKPKREIPPWEEDDPLSTFLAHAAFNERASSLNLPAVYSLLKQVHSSLKCLDEAFEKDQQERLLVPRFLLVRSHSAFLAAVRLSMGGQAFEAIPLLRAAIEQAWYTQHIAGDPQPLKRSHTWLQRHDSNLAQSRCASEFAIKNVRKTHESLDKASAANMQKLYDTTIDFGGDPNKKGVLASIRREEMDKTITYQVGILNPDTLLMTVTLQVAVEVAIGVLRVGQLIVPDRMKVEGLYLTIESLIRQVPRTFA